MSLTEKREREGERERERERCYGCIGRLADGAIISRPVAAKAVTHTLLYHLQAVAITIETLVRLR
jgi:hypothetical protein